jgi:hypothetical protein
MKLSFTKTLAFILTFFIININAGNSRFCSAGISAPLTMLTLERMELTALESDGQVDLQWIMYYERKNSTFLIEKSQDGITWKTVAAVEGKGSLENEWTYSVIDEMPYAGRSYYRVKQSDNKGWFTYSKIVTVEIEQTASEINFYPNPSSSFIRVSPKGGQGKLHVIIYGNKGREIKSMDSFPGELLDISELPQGIYVVNIQGENTVTQQRLVKIDP